MPGILPGAHLGTAHSISPELIYFQHDANREQACLMDLAGPVSLQQHGQPGATRLYRAGDKKGA